MTTLAFIRSIEARQARPFLRTAASTLRAQGVSSVLVYTDGELDDDDFDGATVAAPSGITAHELVDLLRAIGADAAVSVSIPDNSSVRDSVLRLAVGAGDNAGDSSAVPVVAHPLDLATTFASKRETKNLLASFGIDTPDSYYVDGDLLNGRTPAYPDYPSAITYRLDRIGYPIIVKPIWDCLGNGMVILRDQCDLADLLKSGQVIGNVLMEQCLDGQLCSMEVLTSGGQCFFQPIVWKGGTDNSLSFAFSQSRIAGIDVPALRASIAELHGRIESLCAETAALGALEFEFILADNRFHCIEVNPRVSGSTGISVAASGVNSYYELAMMALSNEPWRPPVPTQPGSVAWQLPVSPRDLGTTPLPGQTTLVRGNSFFVEGDAYENILLATPSGETAEFLDWCRTGARRHTSPAVRAALSALSDQWETMNHINLGG